MITQVANPSSVPGAVADYEAQNAHISAFNNIVNNQPFILTNSGGTGLPAIKLGTYIQYGGNLYVVDTSDYAITGTPVDGNNYIRISGTTTLTAEWIQDISSYVWNEVYGYKYTGSYAILPYLVVKDGTEYAKYSMVDRNYVLDQNLRKQDSPTFNSIDLTSPYFLAGGKHTYMYRFYAGTSGELDSSIFTILDGVIPNTGDKCMLNGFGTQDSTSEVIIFMVANRFSSTQIKIEGCSLTGVAKSIIIENTATRTFSGNSLYAV